MGAKSLKKIDIEKDQAAIHPSESTEKLNLPKPLTPIATTPTPVIKVEESTLVKSPQLTQTQIKSPQANPIILQPSLLETPKPPQQEYPIVTPETSAKPSPAKTPDKSPTPSPSKISEKSAIPSPAKASDKS